MAEVRFRQEELEVRLYSSKEQICCEVANLNEPSSRYVLGCAPMNLLAVSSGLRYHFAGQNVLCSVYRQGERVLLDLQVADLPRRKIDLSIAEYQQALQTLGVHVSAGYTC